jgi:hypothetical protein
MFLVNRIHSLARGAALALIPWLPALAGSFTVFGPMEFVRSTGAPTPDSRTFSVPNPATTFLLEITSLGVSSATIELNGVTLFRQSDFNMNVGTLSKPVVLRSSNQLTVLMNGKPDERLIIRILGLDFGLPEIHGSITPAPNAAGWNKSNATVTFLCADALSGIASCTTPVAVTSETAGQNVTGTAVDRAGNLATAAVLVKLDKTPPAASILSPAGGATISASPVLVTGTATDALSGVAGVTCNGTAAQTNGTSFSCPVGLLVGLNSITVEATDVAGNLHTLPPLSVTFNPVAVNQPPSITSAPVTAGVHLQPYSYTVTAADPNNDTLTFALTTFPLGMTIDSSTGLIQWTPPGTGTLPVTVQVSDGKGGTASQSFNVTVVPLPNGPPQLASLPNRIIPLGTKLQVRLAAHDPNPQDTLAFSLPSGPAGAVLNPAPLLEWMPSAGQLGSHAFQVRVQDPTGASDTRTFQVEVVNTNLAPQMNPQPDATIPAGTPFSRLLTAQDPNPGDVLTFALVFGPGGLSVSSGGQLLWTPTTAQLGDQTIKVKVTDGGGLSDATLFHLRVETGSPNRPPVAQNDSYVVRKNATLSVPAPGVLANDSDPDGNPLTAVLVAGAGKGALSLASNGSLTYTPFQPPPGSTEPLRKFGFMLSPLAAGRTSPLVADLDKDGVPEIVFHSSGTATDRRLVAVHGNNGSLAFQVNTYQPAATPPILVASTPVELAIGDIDGDGFPEILAVNSVNESTKIQTTLVAFEHDGTYKWTSQDLEDGVNVATSEGMVRPVIADLDGDGVPEVVVGHRAKGPVLTTTADYVTVFNNQGQIRWVRRGGGATCWVREHCTPVVADINLDGRPEVLFSDDVFDSQGNLLWSASLSNTPVTHSAVANLDDDPFAEVVLTDWSARFWVYEHTGTLKWGPITTPGSASAGIGPFTIGDVNGDGRPDIVLAKNSNIVILNRDGTLQRSIVLPFAGNSGGVTIFDLNGDGKPEIIYQGAFGPYDVGNYHGALYIFDGQTGALLHSIQAGRSAADEFKFPVVADVDGDGAAEIAVYDWDSPAGNLINVFEAKTGNWTQSRPIYNQASYHITNVNRDGTIPAQEAINWLTPGLNNDRVNVPLPQERTGDQDLFTYKANDGALDSNPATVKIDLLPPNTAPRILSSAPAAATPNIEYLYAVRAVDPDLGEVLTFSLTQAPAGMTIHSATGLLRWTPTTAQTGNFLVALKVTDTQGEFDSQGFTIRVGPPVIVPNVVGLTQAAAQAALLAAGLTVGTIADAPSSIAPAGQVISQEPAAGTTVASGSPDNLVVSSGPMPVAVPFVVGKSEGNALAQLAQLGLTAALTRVFSNTAPRGQVMSQNPVGGLVVPPGPVALTISSGTGLELRLQRSYTSANVAIPFTLAAHDLNGAAVVAPAVNYAVTPALTPYGGTLPGIAGNSIVPAADSRGAFRLTATDPGTGRSVSADFGVGAPRDPAKPSMTEAYAQLTEALGDIDDLLRQGKAALAANDTALVRSLLSQMVARWRQVSQDDLQFATPLAPETGFAPTPDQLSSFGLSPTADDLLIEKFLEEAAADLQAWTAGTRAPNTSLEQWKTLADKFLAGVARLNGLTPSEWGIIRTHSVQAVLLNHRIPALYSALMSEAEQVLARSSSPLAEDHPKQVVVRSTLVELAVTTFMENLINKLSEPYNNAKQLAKDVLTQAAWGAAVVSITRHIRAFVHGQDITGLVSGASLSFRVFRSPYSFVESDVDVKHPENNSVFLVGPSIISPVSPFIEKFKESWKYRKTLNPLADDGKYKSFLEIYQDLRGFKKALEELKKATPGLANVINFTVQAPSMAVGGCIFSSASACGELIYPDGFQSVYEFAPPPGYEMFSGLPAPIVFMVFNSQTATMYFDTPPFLPTPPEP